MGCAPATAMVASVRLGWTGVASQVARLKNGEFWRPPPPPVSHLFCKSARTMQRTIVFNNYSLNTNSNS